MGPILGKAPSRPFRALKTLNPYWIWLAELRGISAKTKLQLLSHFTTPESLWSAHGLDLPSSAHGQGLVKRWQTLRSLDGALRILERSNRLGINLWVLDVTVPGLADCSTEDLFFVVYSQGTPWMGASAAVIGTRQASGDGFQSAGLVCDDLLQKGYCVNSGLSLGIDSFAHRHTLEEGGRTQAFVAHGLDQCYPSVHYALMRQLCEQGAVLSPFPVGTAPFKANFSRRSALLNLWSDQIILIEADLQSGALRTAQQALRQGRPLWAVKGPPDSILCEGNHQLLSQGLATDYPICQGGGIEDPILALLKSGPKSTHDLEMALGLPLSALEQALLAHEANLKILYLPDGRWHYKGW